MLSNSHILILGPDDSLPKTIQEKVAAQVSSLSGFEDLMYRLELEAEKKGNIDYLMLDCRYLKGDLGAVVKAIKGSRYCSKSRAVGLFNSRSESAGANYLDFRVEIDDIPGRLEGLLTSESVPKESPKPDSSEVTDNGQILVVEDNMINQKVAKMMLKSLGFKCHVVNNGLEAVEVLKNRRFGMVLMDCQMPIMDGFEATDQIRNIADVTKSMPIIAFTANVSDANRMRCRESGMDGFLTKPIDRSKLISIVEKWFYAGVN